MRTKQPRKSLSKLLLGITFSLTFFFATSVQAQNFNQQEALGVVHLSCSGSTLPGIQTYFVDDDTTFQVAAQADSVYEVTLGTLGFESADAEGSSITIDTASFDHPLDNHSVGPIANGNISPYVGDPNSTVDQTRRVKFVAGTTGIYTFNVKDAADSGQLVTMKCFDGTVYCKYNTHAGQSNYIELVNTSSQVGTFAYYGNLYFYDIGGERLGTYITYPLAGGRTDVDVNRRLDRYNDREPYTGYGIIKVISTFPENTLIANISMYRTDDDGELVRVGQEPCRLQGQ